MGHHPGREAIGVGLRLRSLQILERLLAGFPGLGRDRLHELVVGAVYLVQHMNATQYAVECDAAAQWVFAHIDAFPLRPPASPKGDFQVNPAVTCTQFKRAVQLGRAAVQHVAFYAVLQRPLPQKSAG